LGQAVTQSNVSASTCYAFNLQVLVKLAVSAVIELTIVLAMIRLLQRRIIRKCAEILR